MEDYSKYLIYSGSTIHEALVRLDLLASDATLFVVDKKNILKGSITDGDLRRGFIKGKESKDRVDEVMNTNPKFIQKNQSNLNEVIAYRELNIQIIPVIEGDSHTVCNVLNLRKHKSYLPVDAVIMAGGRGQRLKPLTDSTPKPLLEVGGKPIIAYNIDRLAKFGIDDITISLNYKGEQVESYFKDGQSRGVAIKYQWESTSLGTIGAVRSIESFKNDFVLVMNSDLLTNIDFEAFFKDFIDSKADFSILSIPYKVDVPYAVLDLDNKKILGLKEKPSYTYYSNGGIYLMRRELVNKIPKDAYFNATDLISLLLEEGKQIRSFPLVGYWLDIGNHEDFQKAQQEVKHIQF